MVYWVKRSDISMMVSTKGRYALRVMIDLAEHNTGEYIPLGGIAERQNISAKYLERIISVLAKAGFVRGLRGKGGGYKLTRQPESYTVGSILKLTEGTLAPVACLEENAAPCQRAAECRTLLMWQKLDTLIDNFFEGITLSELTEETKQQAGDNYII